MVLDISSLAKKANERLKGNDNYLTMETFTAGAAVLIVIIIIVTLLISPASFKKSGSKIFSSLTPTPSPSPTPRPIAKGPQIYSLSTKEAGPKMRKLNINEFDPKIGQEQKMTLQVIGENGANIISVGLTLLSDHKKKDYPLRLISGTAMSGTWEVSVITEDSHNYIYTATFIAKDNSGVAAKVDLNFR
ncbi:MAG: hypothetical protein COY68_04350 [Candidatus Levybacteria bacterium CG_4_10_14_0_8_um_filter_35_23]|nr:MAG: hypothetical protein COY68_04350 [Candidatus Levybacteria bacterium CG_4_10_14_0_8_um_filter_35_23]